MEAAADEECGARVLPTLFRSEHALSAQRARTLDHLRRDSPDSPSLCPVGIRGHPLPRSPSPLVLGVTVGVGVAGFWALLHPTFPHGPAAAPAVSLCRRSEPALSVPSSRPPSPVGGGEHASFSPASMPLSGLVTPPGQGRPLTYLTLDWDTSLLSGLEGTLGLPKAQSWHRAGVGRPGAPPFHICTALLPLLWPVSAHGSSGSWEFLLLGRQALQRLRGLNQ